MAEEPSRKRPFGVIVLIGLHLIYIFVGISAVVGLATIQISQLNLYLRGVENGNLQLVLGVTVVLYGILVVFGLWRLQRWAWFLVMIQLGLTMSVNLWLYLKANPHYLTMLVHIIMVFYLNQREVQQAFKRRVKRQEATL